ncbi:uracil phosphoribosyltransferase [Aquimarina sp. MMG015]|uniref:uracil phosphoribosyltransferase n=1 Tax=unclassified Aquimarina TaxID=2627091 RepID=UPI000E51E10B|nr:MULTISPECIES: uracil phosphoribosyltransferase [unclassified Aquimarina]AXT56970.1 uracil phosphoribosyltransferase [Aquimarina sp. AD1]MBQ4801786.1 uracil phosphoribosyltransferase [Aquimarina sp. MMG015]RKN36958.1 uracil phosphoribosyltransferase [Aquimarina sp. AD1]
MIIHNLETENSILNQFIGEIRDQVIQKDRMRFRKNIERIGEVLGYELSKTLEFTTKSVQTPLGNREISVPEKALVLCSILRAGLPLHQGLLNYFDTAENAFISAYRDHVDDTDDFEVIVNYLASPSLENKTLLLADPMLATGKTLENTINAMKSHGEPKQIHIISVIGSRKGVEYIKDVFPKNTHLWIAAIDEELNSKGYIIPGLGDSGDLSYGVKL